MMERCPECADDNCCCDICGGFGVVNIPDIIYLQTDNIDEITWCAERINPNDIEYVIKQKILDTECLCNTVGNEDELCHEDWCPANR